MQEQAMADAWEEMQNHALQEFQKQEQAEAWEAVQKFQEQEMADAWKAQGQAATDACNAQKEMQNEPSTDADL